MENALVPYIFILFPLHIGNGLLLSTDLDYAPEMANEMANVTRRFIQLETMKLDNLERMAKRFESLSLEYSKTTKRDPIGLYRAVNLLLSEWQEAQNEMILSSYEVAISGKQLPKASDMDEISNALFRIQDTYVFDTDNIASGLIAGLGSGKMSAMECYQLAMNAYQRSDYYHSLTWFEEAHKRIKMESDPFLNEIDILAPLAISLDKKDNNLRALQTTAYLSNLINRDDSKMNAMISDYPELLDLLPRTQLDTNSTTLPPITNQRLDWYVTTEQPMYESICRGDLQMKSTKDLLCYYKTSPSFLRLAPMKVEIINRRPLVTLFKCVISDNEIDTVKSLIITAMHRSRVSDGTSSEGVASNARTSSTGWLSDSNHPDVARVRKRVSDATGLTMDTAEQLQVTRYGIGGHYHPHYDHATEEVRKQHGFHGSYNAVDGDRIATFMFYLNEPDIGGATAFPYPKLAVAPSKNDAVFWYNLKKSGSGDYNTLHAGCPVLSGMKWVANQWIKERGQIFSRPCGLSEDDYD